MARVGDDSERLRCSFCQKDQNDVRKLIAGPPSVFICDECVAVCVDIMADDARSAVPAAPDAQSPAPSAVTPPVTAGLVVRCSLCTMALPMDEALPILNRGVLCPGCIGEIQATIAEQSGEG